MQTAKFVFMNKHVIGETPGSKDKPMLFDFCYNNSIHNKALIVFLHGFKGFKDWGHFTILSETFSSLGYPFFKFNFSHNGTTPSHATELIDAEAFAQNNISMELHDTQFILNYIKSNDSIIPNKMNHLPIILMGHSRGGGVAILTTAQDSRVQALITLASLSKYGNFFGQKRYQEWRDKGVLFVLNSRTGQQLPIYWQYMEDLEKNADHLDILTKSSLIQQPWLIIHGSNDEAVPLINAEQLKQANVKSELWVIENANHTFGGYHPYFENILPADTLIWVKKAITFLDKQFE